MNLPQINKILFATSLGPYTRSVYRYAIQMAKQNNSELIILHVITPVGELGEALIKQYLPDALVKKVHDEGVRKIIAQIDEQVKAFFDEQQEALSDNIALKVRSRVVEGVHDESILSVAKEEAVDVIVMGTENKLGIHSQSYTTQKVIKRAEVPVYVVPAGRKFN